MQLLDLEILSSITDYLVVLAKVPPCRQISRLSNCAVDWWPRKIANHQPTGRQSRLQRCTHKMKVT